MALGAHILTFSALIMSALLFFKVRSAGGIAIWFPKAMAGSAAAFVAAVGALGTFQGLLARAPLAVAAGALGAFLSVRYVRRVAAPHDGFERAFGPDWANRIRPVQGERMLRRRWVGRLPSHRGVRWTRDVPFWTLPGADRQLLCDLWEPPPGTAPSGLAFIYLHGGAWHWTDKDFGTRPGFRHLAAQGHVVMDLAYRLCPEVPAAYVLASPICHVGPGCPPTLILQGEDDPFQPVGLSRGLHDGLREAGVPSILVVYPGTEHGFDLLLPRYAPAAQAALYEVDRFLALMA